MFTQRSQRIVLLLLVCLGLLGLMQTLACAGPSSRSAVITAYRQRLNILKREIPDITRCAEVVARRWVDSNQTMLHYVYRGDTMNFTCEFWSRAGGFDNVGSTDIRIKERSVHDVFVYGPRSWEKGTAQAQQYLELAKKNGWMTVVFGSKKGLPANLPIDYLIDNGAKDGGEQDAAMNQIVNVTAGWMWSCELAAALTRLGKAPGVLKGMMLPGATAHNNIYQHNAPTLYPCDKPILAGQLSKIYLKAIDTELADLTSSAHRRQISQAAGYAVQHLQAGHAVWAISNTHFLCGETPLDVQSPMQGFVIPDDNPEATVMQHVKPGDLLFYFGEWSLNLPWADNLAMIRQTKADYIVSYRPATEKMEPFPGAAVDSYNFDTHDARMVLEQHWPFENAAAPVPFPPGKMAPVSGVYVGLQYRMLDEAIVKELVMRKVTPKH